jgi:hypothetical protein
MQTLKLHTSLYLGHVYHVDGMGLSLKSWLKLEGSYDKYGTGGVCG